MLPPEPFQSLLTVTGVPTVVEGDNGSYLYLNLDTGGQVRTFLPRNKRNLLLKLHGTRVKAVYNLRSYRTGMVDPSSFLRTLYPHTEDTINLAQVTGKVVQMSKSEMVAVVRIFSEKLPEPFVVHLHATNDLLNRGLDFFAVRLQGTVDAEGHLHVQQLWNTRVVVPEKFRGWKPDLKWRSRYIVPEDSTPSSGD